MSVLTTIAKLRKMPDGEYSFLCPGCGNHHVINTITPRANGAIWHFNGDISKPTFHPSVDYKTGVYVDPNWKDHNHLGSERCHFIIKDGMISFCSDSSHGYKGHTMPLPEIK